MKRSWIKRKTPIHRAKRPKTPLESKIINKGYKVPSWFNSIKPGSHGNTPAQKRLWRVVAEDLKQREWEEYPNCRGCGKPLNHWNEGHAAHFKRFSLCNSWFKFEAKNLCLTCPACNFIDDGPVYYAIGEYLTEKYGPDHLQWIETENAKYRGVKMQTWDIVKKVEEIAPYLVTNDIVKEVL